MSDDALEMAKEAWNHMREASDILFKLEEALPAKDAGTVSNVRSLVTAAQDELAFNVEWE